MLVAALVALGLAVGFVPVAGFGLRRLRAFDHPTPRSSHSRPTLRGGGLAPAAAMLVALGANGAVPVRVRLALAVTATVFGAIGLADDLRGVDVLRRLALQGAAAVASLLLVGFLGWPGWSSVLVVLWLMAFVNAFNFMDGINGISCACVIVTGVAWWAIGLSQEVPVLAGGGVVAAAAAIGFAPFNFPNARMFLGDVGSYFLGSWLALVAVLGLAAGLPPEAVLAPLLLYVVDTGTTLARRIARGDRWYQAHAEHVYQRLVQAGWSHVATTGVVAGLMAASAGLGMLALTGSAGLRIVGDLGIAAVLGGYLWLPGRVAAARTAAGAVRPVTWAAPTGANSSSSARTWSA